MEQTPKIWKALEVLSLLVFAGVVLSVVSGGPDGWWTVFAGLLGLAGFVVVRACVWWKFG